jgi:hypothetical protein
VQYMHIMDDGKVVQILNFVWFWMIFSLSK